MGHHRRHSTPWALARTQHGVIARWQLLGFEISSDGIKHRVSTGRLHPLLRGVYAVGRREVTREGWWMAGVLACGEGAALSHETAAALWGMRRHATKTHVSTPRACALHHPGLVPHRRGALRDETTTHQAIPVTQPLFTLIDLATQIGERDLEAAINEADRLGLINVGTLAAELNAVTRRPGMARMRRVVGSFSPTDSDLERRFLALVRKAGLPQPETQALVNGHRVDFYWPQYKLVVETDGYTWHRTPTQQIRDRERDQAHTRAGFTNLRFANAQVRFEEETVIDTLLAVARRA
jgi:very-short-patch-repair endonuclease